MNPKAVVALLVAALAGYFALLGYRAITLITEPSLTLKTLGVAVLVFPIIGVWIVIAELRFGLATERLSRQLDVDPGDSPSAAVGERGARGSHSEFDACRARVEAAPGDWHAWYWLAVAYDIAGDRKRARSAMRTAIDCSDF